MDTTGLIKFYVSRIRSVITYACPVWFTVFAGCDMAKLVAVEMFALRTIFPELSSYGKRCDAANINTLQKFYGKLSQRSFW